MSRRPFAGELDLRDATPEFRERFWSKVDRRGPDECWLWLRYRKPSGYGQFVLRKGVFVTASRVSLALKLGVLREGACACHICDNPPCCNPAHLFAGTSSDNIQDAFAKGRCHRSRGEERANAILTESDVREIRSVDISQFGATAALARQYGVSDHTIRKVVSGRGWRHVA